MKDENKLLRDLIVSSSFTADTSNFDGPTELTLYDIIKVLNNRNPNWIDDEFCCMIFIWNSSIFNEIHVKEVCKDKCPSLLDLCIEYRQHNTIKGINLNDEFGFKALQYIIPAQIHTFDYIKFGTSPVRNAYFFIEKQNELNR